MRRVLGRVLEVLAIAIVGAASACASPADQERTAEQVETPTPVVATTPAASLIEGGATPSATASVVVVKTMTETKSIAFSTTRINDSSLPQGTTRVKTQGVVGSKTLTYEVTFTDGVQTSK